MDKHIQREYINGFSKKSIKEKKDFLRLSAHQLQTLDDFVLRKKNLAKLLFEFTENTLSLFPIPWSIAPNFVINEKIYHVPMAIEESSVVAAASKAAKFWSRRGGIKAVVNNNTKVGNIHFYWTGSKQDIEEYVDENKKLMMQNLRPLTHKMEQRGGGIKKISLVDQTEIESSLYKLRFEFITCDAMGANFINSCLEACLEQLKTQLPEKTFSPLMAILSNDVKESTVTVSVGCPIKELPGENENEKIDFASKIVKDFKLAQIDRERAVTHNKGIMNGVDAVVLATGNDFRAVEAACHAYAANDGSYRSLSAATIKDNELHISLTLPLALGTIGGLTGLHPMAKLSLEILGNPSANELMMIVASVGLMQNYAAVNSLVTQGIQKGHMKMHLLNILNQLNATEGVKEKAVNYFNDKVVSFRAVNEYISKLN